MSEPVMVRSGSEDFGKLILRVAVAVLLGFHGIYKMKSGIGWMSGPLGAAHIPAFVGYGVYVAEVIAPILLILGILTRPAALVIAFDMFMAIALVVKAKAFEVNPRGGGLGGELELMFMLTSLAIFFLGSGRIAVSRGQGRWN
jgi:putative oxidoreductase